MSELPAQLSREAAAHFRVQVAHHLCAAEQKGSAFSAYSFRQAGLQRLVASDGLNLEGRDAVRRLRFFRRSTYDGKAEGIEKELHFATCENGYGWMSMSLRFKSRGSTLQESRESKFESGELGPNMEIESQGWT